MKTFKKITNYDPLHIFEDWYNPGDEVEIGDEIIIGEEIKDRSGIYKIKWTKVIVTDLPIENSHPNYITYRKKYTDYSLEYWTNVYNNKIKIKPEHNSAFSLEMFLTYPNSLKHNLVKKYKELSYLDFMRDIGCVDVDIIECPSKELCEFLHT